MSSIYVVAATKNPKIIFDENMFTICIKSLDKTRWRCTAYFKSKCRATLLTYGKYVNVKYKHNHPPTVQDPDIIENAMHQKVFILRSD
ncbi:FLYWCH domain containing protein [Asbolus verrucosus]|uniref:FLYWCH domain containing protein n=1 Tax=Asbolus verrucosus TaxID=1661398 RepID=A0A482W3G4_ASBVE|nr:FLYWCH domain containing protein [Asbolus verrucosus]